MKTDLEQMQQARQEYEAIPVPPELNGRLQQAIAQHPFVPVKPLSKGKRWQVPAIASACVITLFATFSLNPAIAQSVKDVPLLGAISRVFTVQTWLQQEDGSSIHVTQPALNGDNALAQSINAEIDQIVTQHTADAQQRLDEYKEAFLSTGGTEEEWMAHNLHVNIDYQILSQNEQYLSFVLTSVEDWSNAYTATYYYNIDLNTNKILTLQDILGQNYIQIANASILQQMDDRMAADQDITYFTADMDGFTTIDDTTKFYINETGNPVIVFARYEIAPGFMGEQEFEIVKK